MKRRPGGKYLPGILLLLCCLTGVMAMDGQSINAHSAMDEKKIQQFLKMQAENKQQLELRQMESAETHFPGTDLSLLSKAEMEIRKIDVQQESPLDEYRTVT
jgi:hypothetical protein